MTSPGSAIDWQSGDLRLAPLSRRFAALLIDIAVVLTALAAAIVAIVALAGLRERRSSGEDSTDPATPGGGLLRVATAGDPSGAQTGGATAQTSGPVTGARAVAARLQSRPVKLGLDLVSILLASRAKGRRGPGYRVLRVRLVDAHGCGAPSRRQQILRAAIGEIWQAMHRRLAPPPIPVPEAPHDQAKLRAEIESARRLHADDQEALQLALARIFRENGTEASISCGPLLARLPLIVAINLPMPWSPLRQSLVDWLSGTVVVVDRARSADRSSAHR
jgi:uncharacterized RDD family membrane protein YckC